MYVFERHRIKGWYLIAYAKSAPPPCMYPFAQADERGLSEIAAERRGEPRR
jgi:hypothetical protein